MMIRRSFYISLVLVVFAVVSGVCAGDIALLKPEELKEMIEKKADIVVVDNQPKAAYDLGHIPGAVNFPWESKIKTSRGLPRDKLLVLYCACAHEEDATDVANQLIEEFGYRNIKLLEGGWIQWMKLGYLVEK